MDVLTTAKVESRNSERVCPAPERGTISIDEIA